LKNWWSNSTSDEYEKRAQCIINQYGNYTSEQVGEHLNGINTQGENIADNGGIKEAYGGYGKTFMIICFILYTSLYKDFASKIFEKIKDYFTTSRPMVEGSKGF
jgi:predicted metalloendopeptidase